jgi:amino acid permease
MGNDDDSKFKPAMVYDFMIKSDDQIVEQLGNQDNEPLTDDKEFIINDNQVYLSERPPLFKRIFGKMEAGSLRGSIFAMSSLALGTGCLAFPQKFEQMSLVLALTMIIIGAAAAYWSLLLMVKASNTLNTYNYSNLVKQVLGNKAALFFDIIILIYIFGIVVSNQCIGNCIYKLVYKLIGLFVYGFMVDKTEYVDFFEDYLPQVWGKAYVKFPIMFGICLLILIPLCLLKDISKMRMASLFSLCSLIFTMFVIIIEFPMYYNKFLETHSASDVNWYDISTAFTSKLNFFTGTATVFFSFTCHVGAFPVYKTLKNNVYRRINTVFRRSIFLDTIIYVTVGITGFLTQPIGSKDLVIYREAKFTNDIAMVVGRLLISVNLLLSTPANYNAFRLSFLEFNGWDSSNISNKQ